MIKGSCLCGKIKYICNSPALLINHCHCSMCRKVHGSAFGSFLHAKADKFSWEIGTEFITSFNSSQSCKRCFCSVCGANMPVVETEDNNVIIPAGSIDNDPGIKPLVHIFTGSKAPWYEIKDSLVQFEEFPPDSWINEAIKKNEKT